MEYIPAVGDRVEARSKGEVGEQVAVVYTDYWFPGEITKVKYAILCVCACMYAGKLIVLCACRS